MLIFLGMIENNFDVIIIKKILENAESSQSMKTRKWEG